MTALSYIGLSYYKDFVDQEFINVIFQATTANNEYQFGFSDNNTTLPTTWTTVPNISNTIPANTSISVKLPYTSNTNVVWIRVSGDTSNTSSIWQIFNTDSYTSTTNTTMSNFSGLQTIETTWNNSVQTTGNTINTNIYYTSQSLTVNIPTTITYSDTKPLYIMSKTLILVKSILGTNIIIIGTSRNTNGISFINNSTLTNTGGGILELNGLDIENGYGIYITGTTNYSGSIILTGISLSVTTGYGAGIYINQASLTKTGLGTLTLNGSSTSNGYNIFISDGISYSGMISLCAKQKINIRSASITQTGLGTLTLSGITTSGVEIDVFDSIINLYFSSPTSHGVLNITGTITGSFTFGIAPTSSLLTAGNFSDMMTNIPSNKISNATAQGITGTFNTIQWTASVNSENNNWSLTTPGACLLKGTLIHTPSGYVHIEHINKGDEVITADNRIVKVISTYYSIMNSDCELYVIKQNSVDINIPSQDLYLSSGHLVKIHDKYMHPLHFKSSLIEKCEGMRELSFYHLELENFKTDFLRANNLEVESYRNDNIHHAKWDCSGDECKMLLD